jgi:hypothetical protein
MNAVKRGKLGVSQHELQLCDATFIFLIVEKDDGCIESFFPVGRVEEVSHDEYVASGKRHVGKNVECV